MLVLARVYQRRWRYSGQRDYEAVARAVLAIVLLTVVAVEVLRPVHRYPHARTVAVALPNGVIVLFALLALVFLVGVRALARSVYERRPLAAFRGGRKGERSVLIAGAGDGGRLVLREIVRNRGLGPRAGRASSTTTRASAACGSTACACAATPKATCRASSTTPSPTK